MRKKILLIEQVPKEGWLAPDYFKKNGYDVHVFDLAPYYSNLKWRAMRKLSESLWLASITTVIHSLVRSINPNFVVFWNLDYISVSGLQVVKELVGLGRVVCWHGDDLLNPRFNTPEQINKIPLVDIHVTPRHHLAQEYFGHGAKCIIPVSWYRKCLVKSMVVADIPLSFFGSIDDKRLFYLESLDVKPSHIGGNGWGRARFGSSTVLHDHLSLSSMNGLMARSMISLNMFTSKNRDTTNFRNFEIPSQRSLQVCERTQELDEIFREDIGVVCFSSPEELNDKVHFYMKNESSRLKIVDHSFRIVSDYKYSFDFQLDLLKESLS